MNSERKIYEVVDATDGEMYFLMGIFLTLDEIEIDENSQEALTENYCGNGIEIVEIREREYGWCADNYKIIKTIKREHYLDEASDTEVWRVLK